MKMALSYIIVIVLSQFCLTAGAFAGALLALMFFWLPDKVRVPLCTFLGGVGGSVLAVGLAYLIFRWLVGPDSFRVGPFLAATIPLSVPIYNDYKKARELSSVQKTLPTRVAAFASPHSSAMKTNVLGELVGILVAAILFL